MKKQFMFLALASVGLGLASCNGGFKQAGGGLLYEIYSSKGNATIQPGDFVSLDLVAKTDGDSILFSTYESGRPVQMADQKPQSKGDIFTGLALLAEGDSATLKIPADSVFKKPNQRPPSFKGNFLIYNIKVEKVIPKGKLSDKDFEGHINDYMKGRALALKNAEPAKIKNFIAHEKLNVTQTADSLYYQITQPGTGPVAAPGDTIVVNYVGRFLNGNIFDTSVKDSAKKAKKVNPQAPYKPIHIVAGAKQVIPGWDESLLLLNKGAKAIVVLPSKLAYGDRGMQIIGPYTPIAFNLEIVDIIHPNPNAPKPVPHPMLLPTQAPPTQAPAQK